MLPAHIREAKSDFLPSWWAGSPIILDYSAFYFMSLAPTAAELWARVIRLHGVCVWEFRWSHCLEGVAKV